MLGELSSGFLCVGLKKTFKYAFHIAFIVDICEAKKRQMIAYSFTSDANQMCSWQQNHS